MRRRASSPAAGSRRCSSRPGRATPRDRLERPRAKRCQQKKPRASVGLARPRGKQRARAGGAIERAMTVFVGAAALRGNPRKLLTLRRNGRRPGEPQPSPVQPNKASSRDERLPDLRAIVAATTLQSRARESLLATSARRQASTYASAPKSEISPSASEEIASRSSCGRW